MSEEREFLPEAAEQISTQWLSQALNAPVESVRHEVLGEGVGFMGDVLLLHIASEDERLPQRLIAKLPKLENRVVGELLGVYEREIMFFRAFGDALPIRAPRMYFSKFDRDRGSENQKPIIRALNRLPTFFNGAIGWLAMRAAAAKDRRYLLLLEYYEDMQAGDQLRGLDADDCADVLRQIAPLHRQYWNDTDLQEHFWLMELDIDARMREGTVRGHWKSYSAMMPTAVAGHIGWLRNNTAALVRTFSAQAPITLLHGDLRLDNVVFDQSGCAFLDFQMVRSGPAAYDLAYFISGALREDATDRQRDDVLRAYHDALGVSDYSYERLRRDFDRALMIVLATLSANDEVQLGEGRGSEMMRVWYRRLAAAVQSIDTQSLLTSMKTGEVSP